MRAALVVLAVVLAGCNGQIADPAGAGGGGGGRGGGGGGGGGADCELCVGASSTLRLTSVEYERTVRDVFGNETVDAVRFDYLPSDGKAGPFASNAFFSVDPDGVEAYRAVAEDVGASVAADASALLACDTADAGCVDGFVSRIGMRLYRRPLEETETATYRSLFEAAHASGTDADGVRLVVTAMLQSPFFLYRIERGTEIADGIVELSGYELATRLSYFLWKSAPDEPLLAAAQAGELSTAEGVREHARRMLEDPRADYALTRFYVEWLGLSSLLTHSLDDTQFPEFADLRDDMLAETESLALRVMREGDAHLETLLTAPYTYVSPELASLYGAGTPDADGRVALDPTQRGGILTHASFLAAHTNDPTTAAVHRGKAIREGFLCNEMPLPPPVDTIIAPDPSLSTRQKLEVKTSPPSCMTCHQLMNPLGFAFEHYDAMGRFREMDGEHVVDATGEVLESDIPGGFDGAIELEQMLAGSDQVHACLARQWLRFALGRSEREADEPSLEEADGRYEASGRDIRELIIAITGTDSFRHRAIPQD